MHRDPQHVAQKGTHTRVSNAPSAGTDMFNVEGRNNRLWLSAVAAVLVVALLGVILNFGHGGAVTPDALSASHMTAAVPKEHQRQEGSHYQSEHAS